MLNINKKHIDELLTNFLNDRAQNKAPDPKIILNEITNYTSQDLQELCIRLEEQKSLTNGIDANRIKVALHEIDKQRFGIGPKGIYKDFDAFEKANPEAHRVARLIEDLDPQTLARKLASAWSKSPAKESNIIDNDLKRAARQIASKIPQTDRLKDKIDDIASKMPSNVLFKLSKVAEHLKEDRGVWHTLTNEGIGAVFHKLLDKAKNAIRIMLNTPDAVLDKDVASITKSLRNLSISSKIDTIPKIPKQKLQQREI